MTTVLHTGPDTDLATRYLASALRKLEAANSRLPMPQPNEATAHMFIVNPLRGGGFKTLFSTHPPAEERVRRLESMTIG
jgi:heat shock protein HtpX